MRQFSVSLDFRSSLSIQPLEGRRFVRGGRYGISIDFGLEVVEKENTCGATFKSIFLDLNHQALAHDRLVVTRDRLFLQDPSTRISDVACSRHALASATKRLRSNGLSGSYAESGV